MREITATHTRTVPAEADQIWAVIADYARDPEWRTGVMSMRSEPSGLVRPGTVTSEELRLGGRTYRNEGLILTVDEGRSFTWRTTEGADAEGSRSVEVVGPGTTEVTLSIRIRPHGFERWFAPVLVPVIRRNLDRDLDRLEQLVVGAVSNMRDLSGSTT